MILSLRCSLMHPSVWMSAQKHLTIEITACVKKASKKALNKNQSLYIPSEESHSNSSIKSSENSHCYHNKVKSHGDQILSQEMFNMADWRQQVLYSGMWCIHTSCTDEQSVNQNRHTTISNNTCSKTLQPHTVHRTSWCSSQSHNPFGLFWQTQQL